MFGLFRKKEKTAVVNDIVFANGQAKWQALASLAAAAPQTIFGAWFEDSAEAFKGLLDRQGLTTEVMLYRDLRKPVIGNRPIVFIEHHPLTGKESALYAELALTSVPVYSSLDEELFVESGGERIAGLLEKLGLPPGEPVSHALVTKSIQNVQRKLSARVTLELPARNMKEWMQKNLRD